MNALNQKVSFWWVVLAILVTLLLPFAIALACIDLTGEERMVGMFALLLPVSMVIIVVIGQISALAAYRRRIAKEDAAQPVPEVYDFDQLAELLGSRSKKQRRFAVQKLIDGFVTPIQSLTCYPEQKCTDLQLAAAEAVLDDWICYRESRKDATQEEVIEALFPSGTTGEPPPRVRKIAEIPAKPSLLLTPVGQKLDEWSDNIKERMLDWDVSPASEEQLGSEAEDQPLQPLDRDAFFDRLTPILEQTMNYIADELTKSRSDYELLLAERAIHPLLSTLRWEAVVAAFELRSPGSGPASIDEAQALAESLPEPRVTPASPRPTTDWVGKYRRMKAAGF